MKKKKYERLLKKAGKYAVMADYYGRLRDYPWNEDNPNKALIEYAWRYYNRKFTAIAKRADVLDRVFG